MEFSHYDSTSSSSSNGSLNGSASLLSPSEKTVKCEVDNGLRLLERAFPGKEIKEEEEEEQEEKEKEKEKEEWDHPSEEEAGDDKMEANFQNLLKMLEVEMGPLWALEQPQAVPPQLEAPQPLLLPSPPALGKRPRFCAKCQVHNDYHLWQNCQTRDGMFSSIFRNKIKNFQAMGSNVPVRRAIVPAVRLSTAIEPIKGSIDVSYY